MSKTLVLTPDIERGLPVLGLLPVISLLGLGSLNCRYVWVEGGLTVTNTGGNFLQEEGFENPLYNEWGERKKVMWMRENVSYLND